MYYVLRNKFNFKQRYLWIPYVKKKKNSNSLLFFKFLKKSFVSKHRSFETYDRSFVSKRKTSIKIKFKSRKVENSKEENKKKKEEEKIREILLK